MTGFDGHVCNVSIRPGLALVSGGQLTETGYGHNSLDIHRTVVKLGGNVRLVSANISVKFQLDWTNIDEVIVQSS